jgi:hypothetical protein
VRGLQHTNLLGSPLIIICDSKFPLLVHARAGGGLPKQQPKTKPWGCCVSAALGSCLVLIRRGCNASDKLLKPVCGDSVSRRALAGRRRWGMAGLGNDPVQVYRTGRANHWEFLRLWTGFELPSSWANPPGYGPNLNPESKWFRFYEVVRFWPRGTGSQRHSTAKILFKNSWK